MLSEEYLRERRSLIRDDCASPEMPPAGEVGGRTSAGGLSAFNRKTSGDPPSYDTSYICAVDKQGNAFSATRSEEHTSELQSLMRHSYAVFCLKTKIKTNRIA